MMNNVWEEDNMDEEQLTWWEIRDLAVAYEAGEELERDIGLWGYEHGYTWIEGEHFRDSSLLQIAVNKEEAKLFIKFKFDLTSLGEYPTVYDHTFGNNDEADNLHIELIVRNNQNTRKIKISDETSLYSDGKGSFDAQLDLEDFQDLAFGDVEFTVELKTVYTTFFDVRSKKSPVSAKFSLNYEVPQLYKTTIAFKSVRLNEELTRIKLGSNDFNNPDPETGIRVSYDGKSVIFGHSQNSFSYTHAQKGDVYHLTPEAYINITVMDVDYGLNFNDDINDTTISLKSIEGTDYFNLKMKCVDELLIYSQYKGKAN